MISPLIALAAATAAPGALAGVYEGTIGTLPVRACFSGTERSNYGTYYYLSRLAAIGLSEEDGRDGVFYEGGGAPESQPRWHIESTAGGRLSGQWRSGARTLPLRLTRVAGTEGEESPCSSLAFHQPRLAGVRVVQTRATLDGTAYTKLVLDPRGHFETSVETFALDGDGPAVQRINAALGRSLAGDPPSWLTCAQDSLGQSAFEGSSTEILAPTMISRRWLSVSAHWDGYCGGAHPDSSNTWRLFDLTTGAEIDLNDWLNDAAVERHGTQGTDSDYATVRPALKEAVLAGWRPEDAECEEVIRSAEFWNVGLNRDSFTFSPSLPHVVQACGEDFTLAFGRLAPFLTPEGAANVRALQSE